MRSLILDLDRTLVDVQTYTDYETAVRDVEREIGEVDLVGVPSTKWRSATFTAMAMLVALSGEPERWQRVSDVIERHELAAVAHATAMPGLESFLEGTAAIDRCIATLMGPRAMDAVCDRFGIAIRHRVGRGADMAPKPAPDQVVRAYELLEVEPTAAVMMGDSTWDMEAATSAGVAFIGITNGRPSEFPPGTTTAVDLAGALDAYGGLP